MTNQPDVLCMDIHTCSKCKLPCICASYTWACPWRNGDENDMCDICLDEVAADLEDWLTDEADKKDGGAQ